MCNIIPKELNIYEEQKNCPWRIKKNQIFIIVYDGLRYI